MALVTVQYLSLSLCVDGRISPKASVTYSLGHPDMDVDFGTYSLLTVIYTVQFTVKLDIPLPRGKHFKLVFASDVFNHIKINQPQDLGRCCLVYKCAC